jgi:hypothetical protein
MCSTTHALLDQHPTQHSGPLEVGTLHYLLWSPREHKLKLGVKNKLNKKTLGACTTGHTTRSSWTVDPTYTMVARAI